MIQSMKEDRTIEDGIITNPVLLKYMDILSVPDSYEDYIKGKKSNIYPIEFVQANCMADGDYELYVFDDTK